MAATLVRAAAAGLRARYAQADGTDAAALAKAAESVAEWGPISGLIHAAGVNQPAGFCDLSEQTLLDTLAPKLDGLVAAFGAIPSESLRWVVTFGSIMDRLGLADEAHYALANAAQSDLAQRLAPPHTRVHALDWSVWAGAGMGERLGTLEHLAAKGVAALSLDDALTAFVDVLTRPYLPDGPVVLTSRIGPHAGIALARAPPSLRYLDRVQVFYPGQEIVAESTLREVTDPYLADHTLDGLAVVPGVLLLEAMQQAASAIGSEAAGAVIITNVEFANAVTVSDGEPTDIRVTALRRADGQIDAVIRSSIDGFQRICVSASFQTGEPVAVVSKASLIQASNVVSAEPVYAKLLFQTGRFHRLSGYRHLEARHMVADLDPATLPEELLSVYIERLVANAIGGAAVVRAAFGQGGNAKADVLSRLGLGERLHRGDGKPIMVGEATMSIADSADGALAVTGADQRLACDLEPLTARAWAADGPNGDARLIEAVAAAWREPLETAALRVWCARECIRKAGYPPHQPLILAKGADGDPVLASDKGRVVTLAVGDHMTAVLAQVAR